MVVLSASGTGRIVVLPDPYSMIASKIRIQDSHNRFAFKVHIPDSYSRFTYRIRIQVDAVFDEWVHAGRGHAGYLFGGR